MAKKKTDPKGSTVVITPPNFEYVRVAIRGIVPFVQHKFSSRAQQKIRDTQEQGGRSKSRKKRDPRDFEADFLAAQHISHEGWHGIPCAAFRAALISACRTADYVMTRAKLALFVEPDGFSEDDDTPLVRITKGEPEMFITSARNEGGTVDIRSRPRWRPGWEATVTIRYDADRFTAEDVINLLHRAGGQVGIGEGRPDSKKSTGQGWGLFDLVA